MHSQDVELLIPTGWDSIGYCLGVNMRSFWLLCLVFVISCTQRPHMNRRGQSESNLGDQIKDAQTADSYVANLRCDAPDTFRGFRAWRRLSNAEFRNTISDLFKLTTLDYSSFPSDLPKKEVFDTVGAETNFINSNRLAAYEQLAKSVADQLDLSLFFPCMAEGDACVPKKMPEFLELAWRRPATAEEGQGLNELYDVLVKDGMAAEDALRTTIQAVLLSHNFLYRSELGVLQPDKTFLLTDWELASALSYTLWRRPPNAELRQLAAAGTLSSPGMLRQIAEKMLNDPLARPAWQDFAAQWLDTAKIAVTSKPLEAFTPAVKDKMISEVQEFFAHVMFDAPDRNYQTLLTADFTMADPTLDFIYESTSTSGRTPYMQAERRGILGQSGFLASHGLPDQSNPIQRGVFVAERVLCMQFPLPPPTTPPMRQPGLSNKELFKQHSVPACAGCHAIIDNLGFAFENFDGIGRFRATDAGLPITMDGSLNLDGNLLTITSPQALMEGIGNSLEGQQCYTREVFRYGFGRTEFFKRKTVGRADVPQLSAQGELDRCQIQYATQKMADARGDLRTAILELISSPAYRIRLKAVPESDKL
jgi:hypothetical protein